MTTQMIFGTEDFIMPKNTENRAVAAVALTFTFDPQHRERVVELLNQLKSYIEDGVTTHKGSIGADDVDLSGGIDIEPDWGNIQPLGEMETSGNA